MRNLKREALLAGVLTVILSLVSFGAIQTGNSHEPVPVQVTQHIEHHDRAAATPGKSV